MQAIEVSATGLYPIIHDLSSEEFDSLCNETTTWSPFLTGSSRSRTLDQRNDTQIPRAMSSQRSLPAEERCPPSRQRSLTLDAWQQKQSSKNRMVFTGIEEYRHSREESNVSSMSGDSAAGYTISDETTENSSFDQSYALTKPICSCNLSTTFQCVNRDTSSRYCVKVVDRRRYTSSADELATRREIAMLRILKENSSQHTVELVDVMEDAHHDYIVTEFVEGGTLQNMVQLHQNQRSTRIDEAKMQRIARSLLEGVQELHNLHIFHHNINPENVILTRDDQIKLCDFGAASVQSKSCNCQKRSGTSSLQYTAPETLKNLRHGRPADMWSVGVTLFYCLSGRLPFGESGRRQTIHKICNGQYSFSNPFWDSISRPAKQFLANLLFTDPNLRLTAAEALEHPWLQIPTESCPPPKPMKKPFLMKRVFSRLGPSKRGRREDIRSQSVGTASSKDDLTSNTSPRRGQSLRGRMSV